MPNRLSRIYVMRLRISRGAHTNIYTSWMNAFNNIRSNVGSIACLIIKSCSEMSNEPMRARLPAGRLQCNVIQPLVPGLITPHPLTGLPKPFPKCNMRTCVDLYLKREGRTWPANNSAKTSMAPPMPRIAAATMPPIASMAGEKCYLGSWAL